MKKIIFVEKDDTSYDPVATFFNKKAPSVPKSLNSTSKSSNVKPNNDKKIVGEAERPQKPSIVKKEDEITPKIGKKGQYQVPNIPKPYPLKQQVLKSREQGRSNVKKQSKSNILKEQIPKISSHKELKEVVKEDSIQKMKEQQISKPIKKDKVEASKTQSLSKRIKELQDRQLQYQRKIEQLQAKEQKYAKNEQKLSKMQKDFKTMTQKSREGETALQKLKERQAEIKEMLQGNTIPFNRKREVILNNKIRQLKRLNKELILRIKNYKGSDLVDLSVQQNREQITKDLYTIDVQKELSAEMNAQMESLLVQFINKVKSYMDSRVKEKGQRLSWNSQQKFLLQISNLSEKISLNYLNNYELALVPKSNEEAVPVYSILEEYKKSNRMAKAIDRFSLNFNLSRQNMEILQGMDQLNTQSLKLKSQLGRVKNRREDVGKLKECINLFEKRSSFLQILLIQNICQMEYIRDWLQKATGRVSAELSSTLKQLEEIKNIVELGPSAKQSLFLYLETNLQKMSTRFTDLRHEVKHIQVDFKWIQNCSSSK